MPRKRKATGTAKATALLAKEALDIMVQLEEHKGLYRRLDELTDKLREMDLTGTGLKVRDQFEGKNTVWRATGVRRFVLERVSVGDGVFKVRRRK